MDRPGPSNAPSSSATPENLTQNLTGMRPATTLSEWQLQCVLFRANLTQYYDIFIAAGGDDIDQLMDCDETEFLEIMSLVGMSSKPLHVRRLQRNLSEFSKDRETFLKEAMKNIGAPPLPALLNAQVNTSLALQALLSQPLQTFSRSQVQTIDSPSTSSTTFRLPTFPANPAQQTSSSFSAHSLNISSMPSAEFLALVSAASQQSLSLAPNVLSPTTLTPNVRSSPMPSTSSIAQQTSPMLSESDINRIQATTSTILKLQPDVEPKTGQKKPTKEIQSILQSSVNHPDHLAKIRQFSAIYGRSDAKRKPHKILTHHEILINEAATQICLQQPDYLARRSELFALARQVARQSGLQQHRIRDMERHPGEESISPSIRSTPTPDQTTRSHTASVEPIEEEIPLKRKRPHSPSSQIDPKKPPPK